MQRNAQIAALNIAVRDPNDSILNHFCDWGTQSIEDDDNDLGTDTDT